MHRCRCSCCCRRYHYSSYYTAHAASPSSSSASSSTSTSSSPTVRSSVGFSPSTSSSSSSGRSATSSTSVEQPSPPPSPAPTPPLLLVLCVVLALLSLAAASATASDDDPPPAPAAALPVHKYSTRVVRTKYGPLRGVVLRAHPPVEAFLGVPYASPPLGALRYMPPVTPSMWRTTRLADAFAPVCPQRAPDIGNRTEALLEFPRGRLLYLEKLLPLLANQSEDCLYLNVYVPRGDDDDAEWMDIEVQELVGVDDTDDQNEDDDA